MTRKTKAIFFDWGGTLHNRKTDTLFRGVPKLIQKLSTRYQLALISLAKSSSPKDRRREIKESGIAKCFTLILVSSEDKDGMYEKALVKLGVIPEEVIVVDDRTARGVAWGNRRGAITVWIKKGRFAGELPTTETGSPTCTIRNITEIIKTRHVCGV